MNFQDLESKIEKQRKINDENLIVFEKIVQNLLNPTEGNRNIDEIIL